ncbi:MAG TPA: SUMF1/EgtB/PvdO family nonheme iron enzyme [Bacteroidales bacterium]|nr:SUMF1/EgtB/PvdO family nonheme iron enzyme [Bacteroidales bacterium]HPR57585.1 SUMF1/EgtB/PvdO family nonheme iron enzyme [Bacteroidales bacterium]HRW96140.1 SUMF1/EgtB/PvdO family nonheme iron enzyme [Bacteroidales bacterium]
MFKNQQLFILVLVFSAGILLPSCKGIFGTKNKVSPTTGWEYNNPQNGGFEVRRYNEQETGPGLVFIEGGTFVMGQNDEDIMFEHNNPPRRVTVRSFYMDETEVTNLDYLEYLYWLRRVFVSYPEVYFKALPDTLVWRERLAYNEPLSQLYLRHPAYHNYPVVGVSWVQANDYCSWRSDRVNEMLLIRQGILSENPAQEDQDNFNTDAYLAGQYEGLVNRPLEDLNPGGTGTRRVRLEDGIILPKYRLPTEAEWEYAALGMVASYENIVQRNLYPWEGRMVRNTDGKNSYGEFMSNFKRARGDYMGVAGALNDGADITSPVGTFPPNDYGLYNMAGNVAEWVSDVYRQLSHQDVSDFSPYRGNVFTKMKLEDGLPAEKDSLGRMRFEPVTANEIATRTNYRTADNRDYLDGDQMSVIDRNAWNPNGQQNGSNTLNKMYNYGQSSLISNNTRVVKGGSWKDGVYYLNPAVRRYLDQHMATNYIGFRCAMDRVGAPVETK